jgi:hypothetical protein
MIGTTYSVSTLGFTTAAEATEASSACVSMTLVPILHEKELAFQHTTCRAYHLLHETRA